MDDTIRPALQRRNIIDITTTGRRRGEDSRIEIVFHRFDARVYIAGQPKPGNGPGSPTSRRTRGSRSTSRATSGRQTRIFPRGPG